MRGVSPGEPRSRRLLYRWSLALFLALLALFLAEVRGVAGPDGLAELGRSMLASLLLLGKFAIFLGLREDARFGPWTLALAVWCIDVLLAFLLASGLESLERAPGLGRWLRRSRARAETVLRRYPGLVRMAFFGVVAFVLLPLAATGAVSGSFAARLVGLSRVGGVLAIALGSAGTCFSFALLADFLGERAEELARSPVLIGASVLLLVVVGRVLWVRVTRELARPAAGHPRPPDG